MTINTCKDCKNRHYGCHANCERYLKRVAEYHKERGMLYEMYRSSRSYRTIALSNKGVIRSLYRGY